MTLYPQRADEKYTAALAAPNHGGWTESEKSIALRLERIKARELVRDVQGQFNDFLNAVGEACDAPLDVLYREIVTEPERQAAWLAADAADWKDERDTRESVRP
jgi:hypothetical protein